jgi:hypothetical protein
VRNDRLGSGFAGERDAVRALRAISRKTGPADRGDP